MPRRSVRATVALLALPAALFFAGPASAGRRSLMARDLGAFEGDDTIGTALNDRGQMVGVTGSGVSQSAFLLDGAGTVNLGQVAAVDINNGGQILLQTVAGNPDDPTSCFLRQPDGTMQELNTPAGSQCFGADLNDRGQVVGSVQRVVGTQRVTSGFLWDAGTYTDLGTLGGDFVMAYGINELGQVVGSATSSGYARAFFWERGVMTDLGAPGGLSSEGRAINNHGQVALASGAHVYLWEAGTLTDLGTMGGPDVPQQTSVPLDLNDRGQMLLAVYDIPAALFRWGIWSSGRFLPLPSIGSGVPTANRLNELGQAIGADQTAGSPIRHMVLWSREAVRGRRR
jgi:probable HAF family extracellular repeat protein